MKMKSVSGMVCYVKDPLKTAEFYEKLGFDFRKQEPHHISIKLNWFWIDFLAIDHEDKIEFQQEANLPNKGSGVFLYISVENVDEAHQELVSKGLQPVSKPRDWPWGNREFMIRDPDGYKLVIFKRN